MNALDRKPGKLMKKNHCQIHPGMIGEGDTMEQKTTVLLVDDEPMTLKLLNAQLPSNLYNTILASNGATALEKVKTESPDLILLDIMMPEMDGYEVIKRLKENPESRDIPIILITAYDVSMNDKIKGLEIGADEFLYKPINNLELISRVKSLARRS
jgi:two-component system cell cycle response regulator